MNRSIALLAALLFAAPFAVRAAPPHAGVAREQYGQEVAGLVAAGRFDRLSEMADRELASGARFADGLWRISFLHAYFEDAVRKRYQTEQDWAKLQTALRKRAAAKPADTLFLVEAMYALAWQVRGPKFARDVPPLAMKRFRALLSVARDELDVRKAQLAGNPLWYSRRITLALELGEDEDFQDRLFREAVQKHPRYHPIYFARLRHLEPQWGGSEEQVMELLRQVAAMPAEVAAEGMYARIVWVMDGENLEMLRTQRFDTKAMSSAMRAIVKAWPDPWNEQKMFYMACERSDKALAVELLPRLKDPPIDTVLGKDALDLYGMCREWAAGTLPVFVMRHHYPGGVVHEVVVQ